jgi:eukaryotic-like serine/threonine-protein kinase
VVADFGIARTADALAAGRTQLTDTAAVLGTVAYMSPEQRAGAALDHRSDLFSLGVMLYEALTGTLPQGAFSPPSALRPELGARLDTVVLRLLRPLASDRFASAADAARAFEGALAPVRWPRRLALSAAAASVVAGVGGGWWAFRTPAPAAKMLDPAGPSIPAAAVTPAGTGPANPPPLTPASRPPPTPIPQASSTILRAQPPANVMQVKASDDSLPGAKARLGKSRAPIKGKASLKPAPKSAQPVFKK